MATALRTVLIAREAVVLVDTRLVIAGMATGAVGCVTGRRPADNLGIGSMALGTPEVAAVVQRFVAQSGVTVVDRSPCDRVMAPPAVLRRVEVSGILARCDRAVVA